MSIVSEIKDLVVGRESAEGRAVKHMNAWLAGLKRETALKNELDGVTEIAEDLRQERNRFAAQGAGVMAQLDSQRALLQNLEHARAERDTERKAHKATERERDQQHRRAELALIGMTEARDRFRTKAERLAKDVTGEARLRSWWKEATKRSDELLDERDTERKARKATERERDREIAHRVDLANEVATLRINLGAAKDSLLVAEAKRNSLAIQLRALELNTNGGR